MSPYRSRHGRQSAKLGSILIGSSNLLLVGLGIMQMSISEALLILILGVSTIGLAMVMVALVRDRYRARWVFWFMLVYSGFLLINPPVGSVVALAIIIFLLRNWRSFVRPSSR